ncbi:MAG: DUF349 domain-containing protein [Flavobacteriales bacterium]|nr:DUF349 domain-containing protein [Flavobacteriales bacterium]
MATKSELIARMEELLQQPEVEQAAEAVDALKETYEGLVAAEKAEAEARAAEEAHQAEAAVEEPATEQVGPPPAAEPKVPHQPIESAPLADEDDKKFKQLLDAFNTKVNDIRRKRQKEENDNLEAKHRLMAELRELIANEENIGNAFHRFNEIGELWRNIGAIPQQSYRELQHEYSQLREEFFYHIRIYKELRDHDLRKNTALKQALIADMEAVQRVDSVREAEQLVKEYQDKWHQVGPVVREEREAISEAFWNATRQVYDRINEHYKARRAEHEANLASKQALVEKALELVKQVEQAEPAGTNEWKALTDQVLELQNAWKSIGFATKKDNERVWREFRDACNAFFEKKNAHYTSLKDRFKAIREKKEALIAAAEELKGSTAWRQTADKLKALQQQWKEAGHAGQRDEHKLWTRFRAACDAFFQARSASFEQQDAEQAQHVQAKEALIKEIDAFTLTGDRHADMEALKAFSTRWLNGGRVSPKQYDRLSAQYRAALDKQYGQLRLNDGERRKLSFQSRLQDLASAPDGKERIERECRLVKRKIEEVEAEIRQSEENMGKFSFKSAAGEAMKKEMEKSIHRMRQEIERLQAQYKQLRTELRASATAVETSTAADEQGK